MDDSSVSTSKLRALCVRGIKGQPGLVSWRHGYYEALDMSRKSLSGDKA